jgi:S1-C subfamily serine protease
LATKQLPGGHRLQIAVPIVTCIALIIGGCSSSSSNPADNNSSSSPSSDGSATPEMGGGHEHGTTEAGGLTFGESLPPRDDPSHPADLTPQEMYGLGEDSVFAVQGRRPDDLNGFGTGFLVNKEKRLGVTNAHVVEGLTAMKGRFNDGTRAAIHVIASDPCSDLAVVHFSDPLPEKAQALVIGKSAAVQPGDSVTVLGYPATLTADVSNQKLVITNGLVNAVKVPAQPPGLPAYTDTIQHGATINHGNSGGPLLDHHGRVIGINTLTNQSSAENQFYSISIDAAARELMDKLLKGESENDVGWSADEFYPQYFSDLSPTYGPALDQQVANQGIKGGLYVKAVAPGSGASKAGIKPGMLLTRLQDTSVQTLSQACDILESILPGTAMQVEGVYLLSDPARFTTKFRAEFIIPGKH